MVPYCSLSMMAQRSVESQSKTRANSILIKRR
jgi:hypothetical protein